MIILFSPFLYNVFFTGCLDLFRTFKIKTIYETEPLYMYYLYVKNRCICIQTANNMH